MIAPSALIFSLHPSLSCLPPACHQPATSLPPACHQPASPTAASQGSPRSDIHMTCMPPPDMVAAPTNTSQHRLEHDTIIPLTAASTISRASHHQVLRLSSQASADRHEEDSSDAGTCSEILQLSLDKQPLTAEISGSYGVDGGSGGGGVGCGGSGGQPASAREELQPPRRPPSPDESNASGVSKYLTAASKLRTNASKPPALAFE